MGIGSVVAMLIVLTLLGLDEKGGSSNLARCFSFFSWSGFYCYGIYVWHSILAKLNSIFFKISDEITLLAYLSISLAIAPISFKIFERYFLKFKF
jgi:peptidoglycan/LPS O-acetylase OafA/YrhL